MEYGMEILTAALLSFGTLSFITGKATSFLVCSFAAILLLGFNGAPGMRALVIGVALGIAAYAGSYKRGVFAGGL